MMSAFQLVGSSLAEFTMVAGQPLTSSGWKPWVAPLDFTRLAEHTADSFSPALRRISTIEKSNLNYPLRLSVALHGKSACDADKPQLQVTLHNNQSVPLSRLQYQGASIDQDYMARIAHSCFNIRGESQLFGRPITESAQVDLYQTYYRPLLGFDCVSLGRDGLLSSGLEFYTEGVLGKHRDLLIESLQLFLASFDSGFTIIKPPAADYSLYIRKHFHVERSVKPAIINLLNSDGAALESSLELESQNPFQPAVVRFSPIRRNGSLFVPWRDPSNSQQEYLQTLVFVLQAVVKLVASSKADRILQTDLATVLDVLHELNNALPKKNQVLVPSQDTKASDLKRELLMVANRIYAKARKLAEEQKVPFDNLQDSLSLLNEVYVETPPYHVERNQTLQQLVPPGLLKG